MISVSADDLPAPSVARVLMSGPVARVRLSGEIDLATAPALRTALESARRAGAQCYVIDLHDVGFFDTAGVAAVSDLVRTAGSGGVTVVGASRLVRTLLCITGLSHVVRDQDGVDQHTVPVFAS